ncbi:flagellar biogenesis protein FliO [Clostridium tetanomorphum]|uniref:Uncharacterized protein n=1 Tax=Clostridium tetanomorphum TaxID=1553 RepID=A0A923J3C6_CLOTT|nr:hypothetical protein [Clostridium tetanomorphum]KAJ49619.1 hypothetical protein CTM_22028 [Clostridium tetanomorphum DSM 665]KAJ52448.1 hypothetical protein CTM_08126 [Clostridium tetanomorphum DSM 665]MBC2400073.1 hypothetical protein [Clostridium tetanomorphum]MBP1864709.1 flagellar biogenesis protein FliO [Clostridium tetanomorphum]NRS83887.1 flagellar biogenesis protein FliO [Clostridium tetanomorphum]
MQNVFKFILPIDTLFGVILVGIAFWRFKKLQKDHKKTSNDDYLSESEKIVVNKNIKILIIGLSMLCISALIDFILFITRKLT